jgi:hypothetical protein
MHVLRITGSRNTYRVFVGRAEEKIPLGRLGARWKCNIYTDLRGLKSEEVDRIHVAQDRGPASGRYEHGNESSCSTKRGRFFE